MNFQIISQYHQSRGYSKWAYTKAVSFFELDFSKLLANKNDTFTKSPTFLKNDFISFIISYLSLLFLLPFSQIFSLSLSIYMEVVTTIPTSNKILTFFIAVYPVKMHQIYSLESTTLKALILIDLTCKIVFWYHK